MYDEIQCYYPLPGGAPLCGITFQTKDLDCRLGRYSIDEQGVLRDDKGEIVEFTGHLNFYNSNQTGGWGDVRYTENGEDFESTEFTATLAGGVVNNIVEEFRERGVAIKRLPEKRPTDAEIAAHRERTSQSFLGKRMFLLMGGSPIEDGRWVMVVYENRRVLVVEECDGEYLETNICERDLYVDHLLWETKEDAKAKLLSRIDDYESELKRYRDAVAARNQPSA